MTTYNRPGYLRTSVHSLLETCFPGPTHLFVSDDCSNSPETREILDFLESVQVQNLTVEIRRRRFHVGVTLNATEAARHCFSLTEDDHVVLTNSDALYNPGWLEALVKARKSLGDARVGAVIAFNMEYADKEYYGHQVTGWENGAVRRKASVGGLGVMIHRIPFMNTRNFRGGWDCRYVDTCYLMEYGLFATDWSYVQHIGIDGTHSRPNGIIDRAEDFLDG